MTEEPGEGGVDAGRKLGDVIVELRGTLTQEKLAAKAGVSLRWLRDVEQSVISEPGFDKIRRLAKALGVGLDEIIDKVEPSSARGQAPPLRDEHLYVISKTRLGTPGKRVAIRGEIVDESIHTGGSRRATIRLEEIRVEEEG